MPAMRSGRSAGSGIVAGATGPPATVKPGAGVAPP